MFFKSIFSVQSMFKKKIIGGVYVSVSKIKKISSKLPDNQLRYSIGLAFSEATSEV